MKRLMTTGLLVMLLSGCGAQPSALTGSVTGGDWQTSAKKAAKATGEAAIERSLADAQQRFLATAQRAPKQALGAESAGYSDMAAAMADMAALHEQLAALKGQSKDGLSQAEAVLYADVAELEREALAEGPQKKGALGRMRDTFWNVVNKLATKPTQRYFSKKPKASDAPKLPRFGSTELEAILKVAQPGDVILWGGQTTFVHGSIYLGNGEIVHSLANNTPVGPDAQGVFRETIKDYMTRCERNRVVVMRVKGFDAADNQATMGYALKQLGRPYDNIFRTSDEAAFYCTELVYHALKRAAHAPHVGSRKKVMGLLTVVTTDDFRLSGDLETLWSKNAPEAIPAAD